MGKYIREVEERIAAEPQRLKERTFQNQELSVCSYGGGRSQGGQLSDTQLDSSLIPDSSSSDLCILKMLMQDPRVSPELAVNLVMALFRTGIDSVLLTLLNYYY